MSTNSKPFDYYRIPEKSRLHQTIRPFKTVVFVFAFQLFLLISFICFTQFASIPISSSIGTPSQTGSLHQQYREVFTQSPFSRFFFGYDFSLAGRQLRLFKTAHELLQRDFVYNSKPNLDSLNDLLSKMDNQLFPWIPSSTDSFRNSFIGNGIVICVNDKYFDEAVASLQMIREIHNCFLPVEVFYAGDQELSLHNRNILEGIPFIVTKDINLIFDDKLVNIFGYGIKPFALLASSFRNAILIDADVFFFQSPEQLLNSEDFQSSRALFYTDRALLEGDLADAQEYVEVLLPSPLSDRIKQMDLFLGTSFHTQESGVVVIDKYARFYGIMATCFLNVGSVRTESYRHMHGDKETFWIGFETVQDDYVFNKYPSGSIGIAKERTDDKSEVCSVQLLHVDRWQRPLWLNGGLFQNKNTHDHALVTLKHWLIGPGTWHFEHGYLACLVSNHSPQTLTVSEQQIFNSSIELFTRQKKHELSLANRM